MISINEVVQIFLEELGIPGVTANYALPSIHDSNVLRPVTLFRAGSEPCYLLVPRAPLERVKCSESDTYSRYLPLYVNSMIRYWPNALEAVKQHFERRVTHEYS
jgi:hypothetical protein